MFKLESYITPLLFSYVDKYIKNFRAEDSQLSLWGGAATFHNLDLRLEVLEQELQLPFSFVSGHIHELLIHVPWTKLTSEPITITINTIECILKLKSPDSNRSSDTSHANHKKVTNKQTNRKHEVEVPPSYVQSLIHKIIGNIRIYLKNLILKYVEEDIVLSMNVKLLTFESCNEKWEPSYSDNFPALVTMRKLITINDLTICLDKRNSSGKIDVYQEPILYRCSLVMHMLRNYYPTSSQKAASTRLDVYCNNMEFSTTEQQIPMLMRLLLLLNTLSNKEFKKESETNTGHSLPDEPDLSLSDTNISWAGWAWSFIPSIFPPAEESGEEQPVVPTGHTLHIGFYIDNASLAFKISESSNERGYYSQKKLKYWPLLILRCQGLYTECIMSDMKWLNVSAGISEILLVPMGNCTCGTIDVPENSSPLEYFIAGSVCTSHKTDSLFDAEAVENHGKKRKYNVSWDYHMAHHTESTLLDKTPAVAFDFVHELIVPEHITPEQLVDFGGEFEDSEVTIKSLLRSVVGPFRLRICAGLIHRLTCIFTVASSYEYSPYQIPKADPPRAELSTPSSDEFDALHDNVSVTTMQYTIIAPVIEFYLFDHPHFQSTKDHLFKKRKKISQIISPTQSYSSMPKFTLEVQCMDAKIRKPIYTRRLVHTVCQVPDPRQELFDACYVYISVKIIGFCSKLILASGKQTTIIMPFNANFSDRQIIKTEYWTKTDIIHNEISFQSDNITVTATKPKALLINMILHKFTKMNCDDCLYYISNSSIINDATNDYKAYLEICIEDIKLKKVSTISTFSLDATLGSIKAFIFDPTACIHNRSDVPKTAHPSLGNHITTNLSFCSITEIQQVLFVSGPECHTNNISENNKPLLQILIQFPLTPVNYYHPSIVMFDLQEVKICLDPILFRWFLYKPTIHAQKSDITHEPLLRKSKTISETSSAVDTPRKMGTPRESIHSSSDREPLYTVPKVVKPTKEKEVSDPQEVIYNFLSKWFTVWRGMLLFGDVSQCTIYFPTKSLSAIGSQGIQEMVETAMDNEKSLDILVITLPNAKISNATNKQSVLKHLHSLPVKLPQMLWSPGKTNFPWNISVSDISCYSWQNGNKLDFLEPVSLNATVGLCTKSKVDVNTSKSTVPSRTPAEEITEVRSKHAKTKNIETTAPPIAKNPSPDIKGYFGTLGICVHIEMTPTNIILSELQVCLIASILSALHEVFNTFTTESDEETTKQSDILPVINAHSSASPSSILKESTLDSISEQSPHLSINTDDIDNESNRLTAWIQWTITKFSVHMLSYKMEDFYSDGFSYNQQPNLKLIVEAEDLVSSLDFQNVYLKIKSKIGSANIEHYFWDTKKRKWKPGPFLGFIMKTREESTSEERREDNTFANIVVTRASCQHTHNLWGTAKKSKTKDSSSKNEDILSNSVPTKFITEIVITLQPIDFLLSILTLRSFYMILEPLLLTSTHSKPKKTNSNEATVSNKILPLAYIECKGFRIIMPSIELGKNGNGPDVFIFQIENINLVPDPVNPICRTPLRPDIYQQAARARILNIPGSEIEDRQYELTITGISLSTSTWKEFDPIFNSKATAVSQLKTMSENPALEWNLGKGHFGNKHNIYSSIINKFDLLIITAPAMIHKNDVICGHSIEVNFVSNIDVQLSISQLKLAVAVQEELNSLLEVIMSDIGINKRPKIDFSYIETDISNYHKEDSHTQDAVDVFRDSGFETSDLRSSVSLKTKESSQLRKIAESDKSSNLFLRSTPGMPINQTFVPLDILITAGKISFNLYEEENGTRSASSNKIVPKIFKFLKDLDKDTGYEASEEGSIDEKLYPEMKKYQPLLYFYFLQPNAFLSHLQLGRKIQVSCFDISLRVSDHCTIKAKPIEKDYNINLIETKSGVPHPTTGVLPAFFTLKWSKGIGKPNLEIEIAKPTRVLISIGTCNYLLDIQNKFLKTMMVNTRYNRPTSYSDQSIKPITKKLQTQKSVDNYSKFKQIKEKLHGISVFNIKMSQIVLSVRTENHNELTLTVSKVNDHLNISNRPERICNVISIDSITLGVISNGVSRLLLNPWTISVEVCLFWESWQSIDSNPQIQISIESDCIMLDVSPEQLKCIDIARKEITELKNNFSSNHSHIEEPIDVPYKIPPSDKEQHYKDDLRAGAFHFVDSTTNNIDELPLPYQVMFWNKNVSAMAWRYPQPRALTKIRVFPVPFKISDENSEDQKVLCHLEYWSDCHGCYLPYIQFGLSESEVCHLELPQNSNKPAVACTWRVVLTAPSDSLNDQYPYKRTVLSSRALAGCIRVDSYFNKVLIPELNVAMQISKFNISLYNHIDKILPIEMPDSLQAYSSDLTFPDSQCFMVLSLNNLKAYLATWNFETIAFDITTITKCETLDYGFLTMQSLIDPFAFKLEVSLSNTVNINFISKPIHFKFGASIAHTLAVSEQMWSESYRSKKDNAVTKFIVMTHYVICNDTNVNMRFGQAGYEDIYLPSKHCHLYCWRSQKCKQMIRVALEEFHWNWSEAFRIDVDGTEIHKISGENNITIAVTIKSLSATQKQVIFSGQLVIYNSLLEHFEMKVVEAVEADKDKILRNAPVYIISGKCVPPSILISSTKKYFLRLRFYGLESAWSGDIPLVENTKCAQPWLVKVPLQERGQFLSIWCRIVTQTFNKGMKILAILSPLFMVRSNLPVNSKVHIETPTLNVHLESTVRGKGEYQQLYCPGTIDHSHQLSFQLDDTPASNPYVPLNYSLVDQKKFFKKPDNEDINEILRLLNESEKSSWPYFEEEFEGLDFLIDEQPLTHVQVRYQNASEHSSALLVELLPWCLLLNTLGCQIAVIINEKELCRINHHGICTPPKLEETFYLGVGIGGTWNLTSALQLAKSDWSQSFYMPKITGTIPIDGSIKTLVKCDPYVCMVLLSSCIVNEIRLLKVSSTHILTNHTGIQLSGICFAVPDDDTCYNIPKKLGKHSITIMSNLNKINAGIPIMQWFVAAKNVDSNTEYLFYVSFSTSPNLNWSCPVQVDKRFSRRSIAIQQDQRSIPLVLVSQECKGQIYLSLHHDFHPQLLIENKSGVKLFCAQYSEEDRTGLISDCRKLKWLCCIENETSSYYTTRNVSHKFPELLQNPTADSIVFASDPEGDPQGFQWSNPVNVTNFNDQFIRIPFHGDVKISIIASANTTRILVESVSKVEISARDIRVRLLMHENEFANTPNVYGRNLAEYPENDNRSMASAASSYFSAEELPSTSSYTSDRHLMYPRTLPTLAENSQINLDLISLSSSDIEIGKEAILETHNKMEWATFKLSVFLNAINLTLTSDLENGGGEKTEVLALTCDNVALNVNRSEAMDVLFTISEVQIDNQLHFRGSYDFPVVLIGQEAKSSQSLNSLNIPIDHLINDARKDTIVSIKCNFEIWNDTIQKIIVTDMTDISINIKPLSTFIEDIYVTKLMEYLKVLVPTKLIMLPKQNRTISFSLCSTLVSIPDHILFESVMMAKPLVLRSFVIEDVSILLSVHSSIKLYIALDQSPLQFSKFDKRWIMTTPFRLGHAITMHYLSSAIFGAGWVVGSLELLGSPGGLARAMGTGLKDFVSLPYRGLIQGPWAFLTGITYGSASLMKHITAGTLQSVTKLASSVARNLDRLTLDEEHLRRTEEQRRQRPQGITQGFIQGLTGLGISLLGAVGGIAHHPLQSVLSDGASPRSLVTGVGLGLVGVFTKPLSGAADLVALTGQGLLQGAGWNVLPEARLKPTLNHVYSSTNSVLKYSWKFMQPLTKSVILFATEATSITNLGNYEAVTLILTTEALLIVNADEDVTQKILKLNELNGIDSASDPTLLTLKLSLPKLQVPKLKNDDECVVELDPDSRARIADYVKNTVGLINFSSENQSSEHSEISISPDLSADESNDENQRVQTTLTFYVNPQSRNYFLCLLSLLKQEYETYSFPVL